MAQVVIVLEDGGLQTVDLEDKVVTAVVFRNEPNAAGNNREVLLAVREMINLLLGENPGAANTANRSLQEVLERPIETLDIPELGRNALRRRQINTIGELVQWSEDDLLSLYNFGQKALDRTRIALSALALQLNGVDRTRISM